MAERGDGRVRVLVAKPGLDGHDVGAKVVCRALMDAGMEVIYSGLRQSPEAIVNAALEEGVDVVGLSVLSGAHLGICRRVKALLEEQGLEVLWLVGGNIPPRDRPALEELGVDAVFPTGSPLPEIVRFIEEHAR